MLWPMGARLPDAAVAAYTAQVFRRSSVISPVDDAACVSSGPWKPVASATCGVHLSIARFVRIVSSGGTAVSCASGAGAHSRVLAVLNTGHPLERQFQLDDGNRARLRSSWAQRRSRHPANFHPAFARSLFNPATPDRAVLMPDSNPCKVAEKPIRICSDRIFSPHHEALSWVRVSTSSRRGGGQRAPAGLIGKRFEPRSL